MEVTILSGDLDPLQLVDEKIKVLTTRKGIADTVLYGKKEVEERYGLKPDQLIDFKALKGDASDNIPGVPQVGEKTAQELLKEYKTLEEIYKHLDQIRKPALKENLKNNLRLAEMSRKLGTIVTNAPLAFDFKQCRRREIDWEKVLPLFEKFEFDSLVKKYGKGNSVERKREGMAKLKFKCVQTEEDLALLISQLQNSELFAFDVETTSLNPYQAEIVGISFSTEPHSAYYVPLRGKGPAPSLHPLFNSRKLKIGHNLKYDIEVLNQAGIKINGPYFDTMVAAYLLDPTAGKYSLKHLAKQFLGREMIHFAELEEEHKSFADVPIDLAADYAGSDAAATLGLYEIFNLALKPQKMDKLFYDVEMPLLEVLIKMEESGIALDVDLLKKLSGEIEVELKDLERHIFALAGETFNINSPKQLGAILFSKLMLPVIKRTKTGPSTDVEVLEELAGQKFEIAEKLLDYRQLAKLKNTYIDVLPTLVNPKTGRIHTSFNQTNTATGRLSSSEPNLQNIPERIRGAFVPEKKGWVILAADYSQIELRVLASLSEDPALMKDFQEGKDVHQATADELGISRAAAKTVNFGIIYGISDFGLAKQLKVKKTEAAGIIEKYFERHPGVKAFIDKTIKEAKENGYVTTLLGRKRPLPDINNPNAGFRQAAERMAINAPVQGTAADMIKLAMNRIFNKFPTVKCGESKCPKMILQVHDELVFECPEEEAEKLAAIIREEMEKALPLKIPVRVDIGIGKNWAEAKS
jgi:DNA polymerase-1